MTFRGLSFTEEERAFLQQRVALFWKVIFLIALFPVVMALVLDPGGAIFRTGAIMDRVSAAFFGLLWLVCRSARRSAGLLLAVEWMGLGVVVLTTAVMGRYVTSEALAHFIVQVPDTVPGLALESKLGEGGMGVVYRARHGMMRRPTAVKLLKPEQAAETNLKRFEREVQLTARLTHPHTITIFDYGRTPDGVF